MGLKIVVEMVVMFILKSTVEEMTNSDNVLTESVTYLLRSSYYITTIFNVVREGENHLILGETDNPSELYLISATT